MFRRLVWVSVLCAWASFGCGLRVEPMLPDGGPTGVAGTGGAVSGVGGRGGVVGTAGSGGTGGSVVGGTGGTGGSTAGTGGSTAGTGGSTAGTGGSTDGGGGPDGGCVPGPCQPANPCHVGQSTCSASGESTCTDTQQPQANGIVCGAGMVCSGGSCVPCAGGTACTPTNTCKLGAISCATGMAVCADSADKPNGTSCGSGMVCQNGMCVPCQAGAVCIPTNACHLGMLACATGTPVCTDRNLNAAPGTRCGNNMVCNATGVCIACTAGASCTVTGRPCRTAAIVCSSGNPVCTETGNVANGTTCGTNMVCQAGNCVSCTAGLACQPANPCHAGTQTCAPTMVCSDTGRNLSNGTSCGVNFVCNNGMCGPCTTGAGCQHANPCKTGATSCVTGVPVCAEAGNRPNGTSCGTNMVCNNGTCGPCTMNGACTGNPGICRTGTTSCSTGTMTCVDGGNRAAGTGCGSNMVCNGAGMCVPCTAGSACTTNPGICRTGMTSCSTGAMTCVDGGNKTGGTSCGTNMVCNGAGACIACTPNQSCTNNPNPCFTGITACNTGALVCNNNTMRPAGTTCGTNMVCSSTGVCGGCTVQSCTNNPNPCFTGITSCATGMMVCNNNTMRAPGTSCGADMVCNGSGNCVACTAGASCNTNPSVCRVGVTACTTGAMACVDSANNQPNGTLCGAPQSCVGTTLTSAEMCNDGACTTRTRDCPAGCNLEGTDCNPETTDTR